MKKVLVAVLVIALGLTLLFPANESHKGSIASSETQVILLDGDGLGGAPINGTSKG